MRKVSVMHELEIKPLFDGIELEVITELRYQLTPEDEAKISLKSSLEMRSKAIRDIEQQEISKPISKV